ncbi:MAG: hypothetical protein EOP84_11630 [Verrucomicrobiaceae bacterium]|nr:MAG: hypothetical protein EOP84_11630 [Verrucomicrobiaceae bacterium]
MSASLTQVHAVDPGAPALIAGAKDLNSLVLEAVGTMPSGGQYATNGVAKMKLIEAVTANESGLFLKPSAAQPSFCSGATYLVLLRTLELVAKRGELGLDAGTLSALAVKGERDGEGIWGRWNANGPGTARLFHELGLGRNFTDYAHARPGDFMKIFWTQEIGKAERGHSVIFLGTERINGKEHVKFWSSNKPGGYGVKSVPKEEVARAIFSRLEKPAAIAKARNLPSLDSFLAGLLTRRSSMKEVERLCGL